MEKINKHFKPHFFVPGAAKSGTTTLHELLNNHPDISMSKNKEPVYWNNKKFSSFTKNEIENYKSLFDMSSKITGESTISYMYYDSFLKNICDNYKNYPKFIFILRNPIDRFISHVNWMRGLGKENNQNSDIIRNSKNEIFCEYDDYPKFYYQFGLYYKWISRFFEMFGRNNIKIVTLEALINDRNQVLNSCYEFLDLEKLNNIPELQSNKTKKIIFPNIYHFLRKSISGKMKYTQCVKIILPKFFRIKIKSYIKNSLENWKGRKDNFTKFSKNDRLVLKDLYKKDVEKLKRKINYDFKEWEDFKKVR